MSTTRASVLRAAAQLFQTRGINATTIQDITHAASIAKGAFYNYFQSKEQLILELVQHFCNDVLSKATPQAAAHPNTPLETLRETIAAELEVATDYQNFLHAVALDFPPNSSGPVPETIDHVHRQLHAWHKHILSDAFGTRIDPYLEDLVTLLEGAVNHYLMRIFWQDATPNLELVAAFITQSLNAVVLADDQLTPAFSSAWQDEAESPTDPESMVRDLEGLRTILQHSTEQTPGTREDIEAVDLLIDELQQPRPRAFLIDALLSHLASRDHLTTALKPTITSWTTWKGTPQ